MTRRTKRQKDRARLAKSRHGHQSLEGRVAEAIRSGGRAHCVSEQSNRVWVYLVALDGKSYSAVYDKHRREVISVREADDGHLYEQIMIDLHQPSAKG